MLVLVGVLYRRRVAAPEMTLVFTALNIGLFAAVSRRSAPATSRPGSASGCSACSAWCGCAARRSRSRTSPTRSWRWCSPWSTASRSATSRWCVALDAAAARRDLGHRRVPRSTRPSRVMRLTLDRAFTDLEAVTAELRERLAMEPRRAHHRRGGLRPRDHPGLGARTVEDTWWQWSDAHAAVHVRTPPRARQPMPADRSAPSPVDVSGFAPRRPRRGRQDGRQPDPGRPQVPRRPATAAESFLALSPGDVPGADDRRPPATTYSSVYFDTAAPRRLPRPRAAAPPAVEGPQPDVRRGPALPDRGQDPRRPRGRRSRASPTSHADAHGRLGDRRGGVRHRHPRRAGVRRRRRARSRRRCGCDYRAGHAGRHRRRAAGHARLGRGRARSTAAASGSTTTACSSRPRAACGPRDGRPPCSARWARARARSRKYVVRRLAAA